MWWELQFAINSTLDGELFIKDTQVAVVPMPPETGRLSWQLWMEFCSGFPINVG